MSNNFTKAVNSFIDKIHCRKTYLRKSTMTSGNAYMVTLSYKGKRCSFVFNDNYGNASDKEDFLYCLVLDAQSFEGVEGLKEFKNEFGYNSYREAGKAYSACCRQSLRLHRLFTDEEIALLAMLG